MPSEATEDDLRDQFYSFGEITGLKIIDTKNCGFVTFAKRNEAEKAAKDMANTLTVRGQRCKVMWGKPQSLMSTPTTVNETTTTNAVLIIINLNYK